MGDILANLEAMRVRTQEVEDKVSSGFTVEDSNLLEAILEHILIHWDDIMACLIDELVEEEVLELNRLERVRKMQEVGVGPTFKDEFLRKSYKIDIPDQDFSYSRQL